MKEKNNLKKTILNKNFTEETFTLDEDKKVKLYCALSYIYILWVVGLLSKRDNPLIRYHVNQGIIFSIFSFSSLIILKILSAVLSFIAPILTVITALLQLAWLILFITFMIIGIKNSVKNIKEPLPFIGESIKII